MTLPSLQLYDKSFTWKDSEDTGTEAGPHAFPDKVCSALYDCCKIWGLVIQCSPEFLVRSRLQGELSCK